MLERTICVTMILCGVIGPVFAHKCESDSSEQALWIGKPIDTNLEHKLAELFACLDTGDKNEYKLIDSTACNWFAAKALATVWKFTDFKVNNAFLSANEMADKLSTGTLTHWTLIGPGNDQHANQEAAATAAAGHPVVAVWKAPQGSNEHGHVALILPGGVVPSGWGVNVPRAAQLSIDHPNDAFIGCRVSSAFAAPKKTEVRYYSSDLDP